MLASPLPQRGWLPTSGEILDLPLLKEKNSGQLQPSPHINAPKIITENYITAAVLAPIPTEATTITCAYIVCFGQYKRDNGFCGPDNYHYDLDNSYQFL